MDVINVGDMNAENKDLHYSVLLNPCVDALDVRPRGIYFDATAGYGGDGQEILSRMDGKGLLIECDRDPMAVNYLRQKFAGNPNVTVVHDNFKNVRAILDSLGIDRVDGVLADLGLSTPQIKTPERGFSYMCPDAPLDMRMSQEGTSAADLLNGESEQEIARILWEYGEEKFSRSIARAVIRRREISPLSTCGDFIECIESAIPAKARRTGGNPCKRSFQAVRCAVNTELTDLSPALDSMFDCLKIGGRLAVITFQSKETRITRAKFKEFLNPCVCAGSGLPYCVCGRKPYARVDKAVTPDDKELSENNASHSARLLSLTKLADR